MERVVPPHGKKPGVHLWGRLVCRDAAEAAIVAEHLPRHVALTRAEPGCVSFEVVPDERDPLVWHVEEWFTDVAAFRSHGDRAARNAWGRATAAVERRYAVDGA